MFSDVKFVNNADYIAQVDHDDNTLAINNDIWQYLNENEKDFVLWHEQGHLRLDTKSEFLANGYAVQKFANSIEVRNPRDLSQKITFLTNQNLYRHPNKVITLDVPQDNKSNIAPILVAAIIGAVGSIGGAVIQKSNIGQKARQKEATYYAHLEMAKEQQRQENNKKLIIYISIAVVLILITVIVLMRFKKK
ncbi:MAG: hypothetical protein PHP31_07595 [Lentimicrobiaceae bacterium]|nr:hypothetical protein [Lentimicrobiaceae bacterium]